MQICQHLHTFLLSQKLFGFFFCHSYLELDLSFFLLEQCKFQLTAKYLWVKTHWKIHSLKEKDESIKLQWTNYYCISFVKKHFPFRIYMEKPKDYFFFAFIATCLFIWELFDHSWIFNIIEYMMGLQNIIFTKVSETQLPLLTAALMMIL